MSNRIFIDTLFWVALINKHDQYHQQSLELAIKRSRGTANTVLGEMTQFSQTLLSDE